VRVGFLHEGRWYSRRCNVKQATAQRPQKIDNTRSNNITQHQPSTHTQYYGVNVLEDRQEFSYAFDHIGERRSLKIHIFCEVSDDDVVLWRQRESK
jgi:hypothetical protein